ncbi:zinc finger protein 572-like [Branchiostoma lanceolatum]|uniref:zinc finger protein 572-like n=1 Tax=Branchiostoma lanceolatum TaxID=7740 RepID=UPI003452FBD1
MQSPGSLPAGNRGLGKPCLHMKPSPTLQLRPGQLSCPQCEYNSPLNLHHSAPGAAMNTCMHTSPPPAGVMYDHTGAGGGSNQLQDGAAMDASMVTHRDSGQDMSMYDAEQSNYLSASPVDQKPIVTTDRPSHSKKGSAKGSSAQKSHKARATAGKDADKPYKCDECSFSSPQRDKLIRHMKTHTQGPRARPNLRPCLHSCAQCGYGTPHKDKLARHLRTHSGEKPFKCPQCTYASSRKDKLMRHMPTHTGEKPHKCPQCTYATARKDKLNRHVLTHIK